MVHTRNKSLQDGLGDVQTCGTTLASAYVLYCLSVTWLQFPMEGKSPKWKWVQINYCSYTERGKEKDSSSYGGCKLLLSEDEFEVVKIDCGIASIPPFRIDIPPSSESIWFGAKITRMEPDDKVELREILRPPCLPSG